MTINEQKDPGVYKFIRQKDVEKIAAYMHDSMSARRLMMMRKSGSSRGPRVQMTSEYFYFLMIQNGIPFDCEKWHFGRLIALIDCCQANTGEGNTFKSYREKQQFYTDLNKQRRMLTGSKG